MATLTPKELADELQSDPRTVRKFLRDHYEQDAHPGKGSRWAIEKKELRSLRSQFSKWQEEKAARAAARAAEEAEGSEESEDTTEDE